MIGVATELAVEGREGRPIGSLFVVGDTAKARRFSARLFDEGVFAQAVVFPTVALDKARIRTIVTAEHSTEQLDRCLAAFVKVGRELGLVQA